MMKKIILASALVLYFQQHAIAVESETTRPHMPDIATTEFLHIQDSELAKETTPLQISQEDLNAAFEAATLMQNMQVTALSELEMKETEGAFMSGFFDSAAAAVTDIFRGVTGFIDTWNPNYGSSPTSSGGGGIRGIVMTTPTKNASKSSSMTKSRASNGRPTWKTHLRNAVVRMPIRKVTLRSGSLYTR